MPYALLPARGGGGPAGGGSTKPQFDLEVVKERKLAGMICAQPPLEVHGIVEAHRCRRRGLLGGGRGLAACAAAVCWNGREWQWQQLFEGKGGWTRGGERGK